jgi:hypothetical protein
MTTEYSKEQVLYPCDHWNSSKRNNFLELAEIFYKDRFDAQRDGYAMAVCPWLNEFGRSAFRTAFKPSYISEDKRWFDGYKHYNTPPTEEAIQEINAVNDHRVFALLFMHEMHKDYLEAVGLSAED